MHFLIVFLCSSSVSLFGNCGFLPLCCLYSSCSMFILLAAVKLDLRQAEKEMLFWRVWVAYVHVEAAYVMGCVQRVVPSGVFPKTQTSRTCTQVQKQHVWGRVFLTCCNSTRNSVTALTLAATGCWCVRPVRVLRREMVLSHFVAAQDYHVLSYPSIKPCALCPLRTEAHALLLMFPCSMES